VARHTVFGRQLASIPQAAPWRALTLLVLAAALVAACSPGAPSASPTPAKPRTVIFGSTFEPKMLNGLAPDAVSKFATDIVFDGLVRANKKLELAGKLASRWDIAPDGLTYTFVLKPNVRWHDGQPLTADDVKFTFETILNPPKGATLIARSDYVGIERIEAVDKQTVRFVLKAPDASFLSKLQVGVVPRHVLENADWSAIDFNRKPIGTGAFKADRWDSGQQIVFKANPDYFDGRPGIDELVWKVVPDSNVLLTQLQNGEVDGALIGPQNVAVVKQNPKLKLYEALGADTYIGLQFDHPLFQDVRVRQALHYGLDKRAIIDKILQGQAVQATTLVMADSWAHNPGVNLYPYNPGKARQLLADAGWQPGADGILVKDGKPFKFSLLTNVEQPERKDITLFARQQWRELGIGVEPEYLDLNTFIFERVLKGNFDAILLAGTVNIDPDYLRRNLATDSIKLGFNFLHYSNPKVDELITQGLQVTNQAGRKKIYDQVQQLIVDDVAMISLYHPKVPYAFRADLQGIDPTDLNLFWNTHQWRYQ
jgi:peptide/nickel transport system substrate-binding protein